MTQPNKGTLYFIPVTLGDNNKLNKVLPKDVVDLTHTLDQFIVEDEKTARQFLSAAKHPTPIRELTFTVLNKDTADKALPGMLHALNQGENVGLMSEAGCPGVADPGARLAALAHQKGYRVAPLVGPSSILLSLMASGMNGQQFAFLGYIPIEKSARQQRIKDIEKRSRFAKETQIFIETPYRNMHLLEDILANTNPDTKLCIACNVSLEDEYIQTKPVKVWKQGELPELHKKPTVFLLQA